MKLIRFLSRTIVFIFVFSQSLFSQDWVPLALGNKWQYLTDSKDDMGNIISRSMFVVSVDSQFTYDSLTYYRMAGSVVRYQKASQSLFLRQSDTTDHLEIDFSDSVGYYYLSYDEPRTIIDGHAAWFDSVRYYRGFDFGGMYWYGNTRYFQSIGKFFEYYHFQGAGGQYIDATTNLIQALIYDDSAHSHYYSHDYSPSFRVLPVTDLRSFRFQISIIADDQLSGHGFSYVDTVIMYSNYSKDSARIENLPVMMRNSAGSIQYTVSVDLDSVLLKRGYFFNYRFTAKDKGFIPRNAHCPDSGYFSAHYVTAPSPRWTIQSSGITTQLSSVIAVTPSNAWAVGMGGVILTTTDGGTHWNKISGGPIGSQDLYAVDAIDANTAFVTSTSGPTVIYRTTDAGASWGGVFTLTNGFIDAIKMFDSVNGIAVGDPVGGKWTILRTGNGGSRWIRIATEPAQVGNEYGWNNAVAVVGPSNIWFSTNSGRIYHTTDGGETWSSASAPFLNTISIAFSDAQYGLAGSDYGAAARTTDGGATWLPVSSAGPEQELVVTAAAPDDFFLTYGGWIYRSETRGASWETSFTGSVGSLGHASFVKSGSDLAGWGVSINGEIVHFSETVTGLHSLTENSPTEFVLRQNYPNPFNPETRIEFSLPRAERLTLKIFNALGEEVTTLADDMMSAGTHELIWNGKNSSGAGVASGVYFYRVVAGDLFATKKMILLK